MKYVVITKKHLLVFICCFMASIIAIICSVGVLADSDRKLPIYCVETPEKKIAISFDAAWGNDDTETLINILEDYDAKATFFVVGAWVDKYPESVKQLSDAGHQVMNHSNTHPYMTKLTTEQMIDELKSCNEKICKITNKTPTLFRPPYGDYDNATIETVEKLGMYTIQWDVDSLDWKDNASPESICKRVTSKVKNGSIVLFHNQGLNTAKALRSIIKALKGMGYTFVPIGELIYRENYTIDANGRQHGAN
jgi:polysaccharide deacetylase family sporulation protein PdaB